MVAVVADAVADVDEVDGVSGDERGASTGFLHAPEIHTREESKALHFKRRRGIAAELGGENL